MNDIDAAIAQAMDKVARKYGTPREIAARRAADTAHGKRIDAANEYQAKHSGHGGDNGKSRSIYGARPTLADKAQDNPLIARFYRDLQKITRY